MEDTSLITYILSEKKKKRGLPEEVTMDEIGQVSYIFGNVKNHYSSKQEVIVLCHCCDEVIQAGIQRNGSPICFTVSRFYKDQELVTFQELIDRHLK